MRNAAGFYRGLQRFIRGIGNRRHQQRIGARENGAHRGFARSETRGDSAHVHGVGDHQTLEMKFIAQQTGQYVFRKCGGSIGIGLERRNRKMAGHDAADSRGNRGTEGNQFQMLEAIFVRANYRKIDVRIRGGVAVSGKMFRGGQAAIFFHAAHERDDKFGDALRDLRRTSAC